jgi:hypothetical protein
MAKILVMPDEGVISGYKGKLDYYFNMGIPCVRKWPRSPGKKRAPAVMAGWASFTYATKEWSNLSPAVQDAYNAMAGDSALSGRDMFERAYLKGLYRNPTP